MQTIILIFICTALGFITVCSFFIVHAEKKEKNKIKKELDETYIYEEYAYEAISNANKTKSNARTGDPNIDIKYMADQLHKYANK